MRILSIVGLVLALIAIAVSAYARFQVFPDFQDASQAALHADSPDVDIVEDLRSTLNLLAWPSFGLAGLAMGFGIASFIWGRHPIGIVASVFGFGAVVLALMARPTPQVDNPKKRLHVSLEVPSRLATHVSRSTRFRPRACAFHLARAR